MADQRGVPWPQYGELSEESVPPHALYSPSAVASSAASTGEAPRGDERASSVPGNVPPAGAAWSGASVPSEPLSRKAGIWMLVGGLLMSFILAPALMVTLLMTNSNVQAALASARSLTQQASVTVDASGGYLMQTQNVVSSCELVAADGTAHAMNSLSGIWTAKALPAGDYTVSCTPAMTGAIGMTGMDEDSAARVGLLPMGAATLVGITGLVLAVWGGVKLYRVGQRRRIQFTQMPR